MGRATILTRLAARRKAVAAGAVIAVIVGLLMTVRVGISPPGLHSRRYQAGTATAAVLLDSARSQVSDLGDSNSTVGPGAVLERSAVIGNLLVASPLREQIAALAGVDPRLLITKLSSNEPGASSPPPAATGVIVKEGDRAARMLGVHVDAEVPILTFSASAPTVQQAGRLAAAAVTELRRYLQQRASADSVPAARTLVAAPLGGARASAVTRGPGPTAAFLVALVTFALWCAGVLALDARRRPEPGAVTDPGDEDPAAAPLARIVTPRRGQAWRDHVA